MPAYQTLPFTKEDVPPPVEQDTEAILRIARVAGAALRQLRETHEISTGRAVHLLNVTAEELSRAEGGQLIEVTRRGRVIDIVRPSPMAAVTYSWWDVRRWL